MRYISQFPLASPKSSIGVPLIKSRKIPNQSAGMTKKNQTGPSTLVGLCRKSVFCVPAFSRNLCFLIEFDGVTFSFYYAGSAVISPMMPIDTTVAEKVEAKKKSPARIANTKIYVQVLQWALII
jgi:hypothetical protein